MNMLENIASRSTCLRRQVGAIITKDNRIVSTGYNGQPPGLEHCSDRGFCLREKFKVPSGQRAEICRAVHAEESAILQASHFGINLRGATIYINDSPCSYCTKSILSIGIDRVVYKEIYPDDLADELRKEATWVEWVKYQLPRVDKETHLYSDEALRLIEDFPTYSVSNFSRIFKGATFEEIIFHSNLKVVKLGKLIKKTFNSSVNSEQYISLLRGALSYNMGVGWLTAKAWVDNPNNYSNLRWKDGNKVNNYIDNLEWCE